MVKREKASHDEPHLRDGTNCLGIHSNVLKEITFWLEWHYLDHDRSRNFSVDLDSNTGKVEIKVRCLLPNILLNFRTFDKWNGCSSHYFSLSRWTFFPKANGKSHYHMRRLYHAWANGSEEITPCLFLWIRFLCIFEGASKASPDHWNIIKTKIQA